MLFGREYMPEGAGVDPDAPRKKGAARLWEILSRDLDGIFLSGVLAMLACAPAAILAGVALWLGSLPLCLLAAAAAGAAGRGVRRALAAFPVQGLSGQLAVLTAGGTVTAIVYLLAALPLGLWEEVRAVLRQAKTGKNRGK